MRTSSDRNSYRYFLLYIYMRIPAFYCFFHRAHILLPRIVSVHKIFFSVCYYCTQFSSAHVIIALKFLLRMVSVHSIFFRSWYQCTQFSSSHGISALNSWLFYPLADCPPNGSSSMDDPPYELSTGFQMIQPLVCGRKRWVTNCMASRGFWQS